MIVNQKRKNNAQTIADMSYIPVPVPCSPLMMKLCVFFLTPLKEPWCGQQPSVTSQCPCGYKPRMLVSQSTGEPEEN